MPQAKYEQLVIVPRAVVREMSGLLWSDAVERAEGKDTTHNVLTLCLACHQARHVTRALTMTGNANQPVTFERDGQQWKG